METVKGPDRKDERIERMVNLYQLSLLRLCVMYLHDEEQAKDAVQETFIKAYRNLDSFRADASEKTCGGDHEPSRKAQRGRAAVLAAGNDL